VDRPGLWSFFKYFFRRAPCGGSFPFRGRFLRDSTYDRDTVVFPLSWGDANPLYAHGIMGWTGSKVGRCWNRNVVWYAELDKGNLAGVVYG